MTVLSAHPPEIHRWSIPRFRKNFNDRSAVSSMTACTLAAKSAFAPKAFGLWLRRAGVSWQSRSDPAGIERIPRGLLRIG